MLTDDQQAWAFLALIVLAIVVGFKTGPEGMIGCGLALGLIAYVWGK